jgi:hypothetical protein
VETGQNVNVALSNQTVVTDTDNSSNDSDKPGGDSSCPEEVLPSKNDAGALVEGAGVAYKFDGNGILRGRIEQCNDNGTYALKLTNGKVYTMNENKAMAAR